MWETEVCNRKLIHEGRHRVILVVEKANRKEKKQNERRNQKTNRVRNRRTRRENRSLAASWTARLRRPARQSGQRATRLRGSAWQPGRPLAHFCSTPNLERWRRSRSQGGGRGAIARGLPVVLGTRRTGIILESWRWRGLAHEAASEPDKSVDASLAGPVGAGVPRRIS